MNSRTAKLWFGWVLPLFALRGLVPAGFMLDASSGTASMVICSGGAYKAVLVDRDGSIVDAIDTRHSQRYAASLCPFAVAAVSASGPVNPLVDCALVHAKINTTRFASRAAGFGPNRAQHSQGPPRLS